MSIRLYSHKPIPHNEIKDTGAGDRKSDTNFQTNKILQRRDKQIKRKQQHKQQVQFFLCARNHKTSLAEAIPYIDQGAYIDTTCILLPFFRQVS